MGKTVLAQGVGAGLGVTSVVRSPTFILVAAHEGGRLPLWHADLYRLGSVDEVEQLGLDEILEGDGVAVLEWADRFPEALPADVLWIRFAEVGDGRVLTLDPTGPRHRELVGSLG